MATIGNTNLTIVDWAARVDPDGKPAVIAELLMQYNPILTDAVFVEANGATTHRVTVRTGLPTVYWRMLNAGVPTSKSTTAQVDEGIGILEGYSEIDVDVAKLNGNTAAFRLSEDKAFLESMSETMAQTLIYGNPAVDPKTYLGLAPRYSSLSSSVGNSQNIIDAGGTGTDNTSIWLVVFDDDKVFCTFPRGSESGGLMHKDLGEDTIIDANGGRFQAYRTHFQWKNGLVVRDWRYVVRIANIDVSNLVANTSAADLINLMSIAIDRLPTQGGNPVFYANRTVASRIKLQGLSKSGSAVTVEPGLRQFETGFLGIPVRKVDQILNTEARVTS